MARSLSVAAGGSGARVVEARGLAVPLRGISAPRPVVKSVSVHWKVGP